MCVKSLQESCVIGDDSKSSTDRTEYHCIGW